MDFNLYFYFISEDSPKAELDKDARGLTLMYFVNKLEVVSKAPVVNL